MYDLGAAITAIYIVAVYGIARYIVYNIIMVYII